MNQPSPPKPSRAGREHDKPYTSQLQTYLERRQATVFAGELGFSIHLEPDAPSTEARAWKTQTDLANALGEPVQAITNLNKRRGGANIELAKKIERQLVSWGLVDTVGELNALRRVVGAPDLDPKNPDESRLIAELTRDDSFTYPASPPELRPDERRPFYIRRPEHDALTKRIRQADPSRPDVTGIVTAVQGTGGGGKTTLAKAVTEELSHDQKFDRVVRLYFSKTPHLANLLHLAICKAAADDHEPVVSDLDEGRERLANRARGKRLLVLLDDVWNQGDLDPFLAAFAHCSILITTRFPNVVRSLGDVVVLNKFSDAQALQKISAGLPSGQESRLQALATNRLKNWPLALDLANAFLFDQLRAADPPLSLDRAVMLAEKEYDLYGINAFDQGDDNPVRSTDASIRLNLSLLKPDELLAFQKLAIFPEDARIPRDLLDQWHAKAWDELKVQKFCNRLKNLALTQEYEGIEHPFIQLHDHIWKYLRDNHADKIEAWQREFLSRIRPDAISEDTGDPWPSSPWARLKPNTNDYLWRNLEHHLTEAGLQHEWREAVCDWHFIAGRAAAQGTDLSDITGWDADLFARAREAPDPDAFIRATLEDDDVLGAAHCAGLPGIRHRISIQTRDMLRELLLREAQSDPGAAWRDHAIRRLFELGHPQFKVTPGRDGVRYVEPPHLRVHGGDYPLGDDNPPYTESFRSQEMPLHRWPIPAFDLGIYPITNAEFAWFVRAGGYDDERWWVGEKAQAWRTGRGTGEHVRKLANTAVDLTTVLGDQDLARLGLDTETIKAFREVSIDEFRQFLSQTEDDRFGLPGAFTEFRFGHPSQPVCVVSFYEAVAYCRWLSHVSGRQYTLPSEDQWEAAGTSSVGHHYPFASPFSKDKCNTRESDVRRTTPVGAFPNGATPEDTTEGGTTPAGIHDLAGNVWEWTISGFDLNPYDQHEYLPARNVRPDGSNDVSRDWPCRVVRGGSWSIDRIYARAAFRYSIDPASRLNHLGFRVVLRP